MNYCIIPQPYRITEKEGCFRFRYDTKIVLGVNCGENEYFYAKLLNETIEEKMGFTLDILKGQPAGENGIFLEKTSNDTKDDGIAPDWAHEAEYKIKEGAYSLQVTEKQIVIQADYSAGILYGVETMRQLISELAMTIPCLEIEDRPALPNRGFYHDATRGRVEKLSEYRKLADKCAYYKLNQLQLYVEHSYMFRDFSEVWKDDTPLTAGDIMELDTYCRKLGIELVPSLASFGHMDKILKTKTFTDLCELPDSDKERFSFQGRMAHHTLNVTDPEAWELIKSMLDEFIPLFSSKQFNLCGDETFDLGKGRSKARAEVEGTHRLYADFVKKICDYLVAKGKRPMFWGDIIVQSPELVKELPSETVCLTWGYSENESDRSARVMAEAGATQYLCPGVHGWRHLINKTHSAYANISRMCEYAMKFQAIGLLNTDWGDYGHMACPAFSTMGLIYGAEGSWGGRIPGENEENQRISKAEYGDKSGKIAALLSDLGDCEAASWGSIVDFYEFGREKDSSRKEELKQYLAGLHIEGLEEKNQKICSLTDKLTELSGDLNANGRAVLYSYLLHAKGQELFNRTIAHVKAALDGPVTGGKESAFILASDLEKWFTEYKNNWRKTSRESELYRVQEVVFWYCDRLRTLN